MAVFEKHNWERQIIDDTQEVLCVIETAQEVNGHTEYVLRLHRGTHTENYWKILRRYNEFAELHNYFCLCGINLPMPGKRLIGNMRSDFIAQRKQALQVFINTVLMNPILASSLPAKRFIDPDSYSQSFHDHVLQNALICLRNEGIWILGNTLGPIGWRLRKYYFEVSPKPPEKTNTKLLTKSGSHSGSNQAKNVSTSHSSCKSGASDSNNVDHSDLVLEWLDYGPDKYIYDKELGAILKSLTDLQHPYIDSIVYSAHNESGCLTIRKFYKNGTLKDILCMSTPKKPFLSKYGNPKGRTALSLSLVAGYGIQILEALIFLHSKGYPYGHLHSGNIAIMGNCIKLLDIENYILGVPAFYRPFFVQHSKIHSSEAIDVYCFGHVLFEMSMGYPLQESVLRQTNDCPQLLKNLLESILSKEACRAGLPTLKQLSSHDFFSQYASSDCKESKAEGTTRPHFKLSLNSKELIKEAAQKCENRLRDEQKSVKNQKRIVRVQELMSFEEEKRKTKQKNKLEQKQSKLRQQSSLQATNGRLSLSMASSSATAAHNVPFNRSSSTLSIDLPQESITNLQSNKFPPLSPLMAEKQLTIQKTFLPANVERQWSSPNISTSEQNEPARSALLESICKFNRGSLRKVRSND